jgi:serine/threonine protein kinase
MSDPLGRNESLYHATLAVGARIGVYEIVAPIGAGGMGEVYRAHDQKLGRDVAIKVLPQSFVADPDRQARFEREARLLAALNHPDIAQVYGLEESHGVLGLVMELVEGDTLADRIARGPIPIAEALPIARQIAEALAAAHEQGVIHRDLKPANVKVRPDGSVKVLDFGLAKWIEPAAAADALNSPTLSARSTQQGLILGTAGYMSPEQATGKPVDRRTDLWSFGVVLMEMLTGRSVFRGDAVPQVLAAVLTSEPEWNSLPSGTPDGVRRLLRRCLERDPKRRLDSAGVARLELEEVTPPRHSRSRKDQKKSPAPPELHPSILPESRRVPRSERRDWSSQPRLARVYIAAVIALGAASVVFFIPRALPRPGLFAFTLLAACLTSAWKVNLPDQKGASSLSVSYAAGMMALLLLGPELAIVIAAVAAWVQCTVNIKYGHPLHQTVFSTAAEALTMALTGIAYRALGGTVVSSELVTVATVVKPVAGAIATYFCINSGLVAGAIALSTGQRVSVLWRQQFLWSAASFMVSGAAGAAAAMVIAGGHHWTAILLLAPVYLIYRTYGVFVQSARTRRPNAGRRSSTDQDSE